MRKWNCRISRVRENICATDFSRHDVLLVIIHFQPVASHPVSHRFWARLDVHQQFSKVLGAGRFVQLRVLCKQVVQCVVVPNDMAQCRDVDGEQHRAQRTALRYTVLQHRRLAPCLQPTPSGYGQSNRTPTIAVLRDTNLPSRPILSLWTLNALSVCV